MLRLPVVAVVSSLLALAGCAAAPTRSDPFEPVNRKVDSFNQHADKYVIRPVAEAYTTVLPEPVRIALSNFFSNLGEVRNTVNNALQCKPEATLVSLGRFAVNSTLGLAGFIDVMTPAGFAARREDLGQTLGYWGVGSGPYLVLPLLGPSTLRDSFALIGDYQADPVSHVSDVPARNSVTGLRTVHLRSELLGVSDVLDTAALDPYAFTRDAYLQRRQSEVYDGAPPAQIDPDDPFADEPKTDEAK